KLSHTGGYWDQYSLAVILEDIKHRQTTISNHQLNPPPPISEYPGPDQKQAFVTSFDSTPMKSNQ
ncbi:hypothetical protein DL98DRAFT_521715, partial [Cadophora sp. DSE1049]